MGDEPPSHLGRPELLRLPAGDVPNKKFRPRKVEVEEAAPATMVPMQPAKHLAVPLGREDAFEGDVEAPAEGDAGHAADHLDVGPALDVGLPENVDAHGVLRDDRQALTDEGPQTPGCTRLPRRRVAPQDDQGWAAHA
nr:hypothetical protein [Streptomyces sp. LS1784]